MSILRDAALKQGYSIFNENGPKLSRRYKKNDPSGELCVFAGCIIAAFVSSVIDNGIISL